MTKKIIGFILAFTFVLQGWTVVNAENADKPNFFKYAFSCIFENIKKTYTEYENNKQTLMVPKTAEDIVTVTDVRRGVLNEDDVYLISYCMNGIVQKEPLVAEYDCQVSGMKSNMEELSCGDMIIIDTHFDSTVDFIRVVMSLDNFDDSANFSEQISVPEKAAWYLYGTQNKAKNEVYFGYIMKKSVVDGKVKLVMCNETGSLENSEIFTVSETAAVSFYNAYKNDEEKRFEKADIYDIEESVFPAKNGNIDFESEDFSKDDMKYAFIYIKRGEIKEILLVNY